MNMSEHSVGSALNELIATKVMGWHLDPERRWWWIDRDDQPVSLRVFDSGEWDGPFDPSNNIAHAWLVVEKLKADGWAVSIHWNGSDWRCELDLSIDFDHFVDRKAESAPLVICLASLGVANKEYDE